MNEILAKINSWIHRKEAEKFTTDGAGDTAVNVVGQITPRGLYTAGQVTKIPLDDTSWTPLERSALTIPTGLGPLSGKNSMSIQNRSKKDMLLQYDNTNSDDSVAILVKAGSERFYDIEGTIVIYAKTVSGSADIILEELS